MLTDLMWLYIMALDIGLIPQVADRNAERIKIHLCSDQTGEPIAITYLYFN